MVELVEVCYLVNRGNLYYPRVKSFPLKIWKNGRLYTYFLQSVLERASKWLKKRNLTGSIYLLSFDREFGSFIKVEHLI